MNHQFDMDHAKQFGVHSAILLNHFQFWILNNRANDRNQKHGRTWTYNSIKSYAEQFPYLSVEQVRHAIDKLVEKGVLVKACWNDRAADRTSWYAFSDEATWLPDQSHLGKTPNEDGKYPKTLITTVTNTDTKKPRQKRAASSSGEVIFDDWLAVVKASGCKPIPEDHEILKYAKVIKMPDDYLGLCWFEFKRTFTGNDKKKYIDWSKTFSNYVRKNYFGLWFEKDDAWLLTTAGKQLQKEMRGQA